MFYLIKFLTNEIDNLFLKLNFFKRQIRKHISLFRLIKNAIKIVIKKQSSLFIDEKKNIKKNSTNTYQLTLLI